MELNENGLILLGISEFFIFILLVYGFIKMIKKENKLSVAMDHFKTPILEEESEIIDVIEFSQDYSKELKLFKAMENNEDYYKEEVAKILAKELVKNGAVQIDFLQGLKKDTIKGKIKYIVKV